MIKKTRRKIIRYLKKRFKNRSLLVLIAIGIFCFSAIAYTYYMQNRRLHVDPASYAALLEIIGKAESKNNYNAFFGNPGNKAVRFTDMSIGEVMQWQADFVKKGNLSSAVGRYQIIDTTLAGLIDKLGIDRRQKFDQTTQDKLAIALLERRGAEAYINRDITREEFAANLAKEWAGLPKITGDKPGDSYYASDGINKALVTVDEVLIAVGKIKPLQ